MPKGTTIEEFRLPVELEHIKRPILLRLLPDVSVSIDEDPLKTTCTKVTFTVHLVKGFFSEAGETLVKVHVRDVSLPNDAKSNRTIDVQLDSLGDSFTMTVDFGPRPDATYTPDFHNEWEVEAEPIGEFNLTNNKARAFGTCIG